ncbi:MAG: hypothetical protein QM811_12010 [Pirellulales bacterium]
MASLARLRLRGVLIAGCLVFGIASTFLANSFAKEGEEKTPATETKVSSTKTDLTKILAGDAPATLDELKELERVVTDVLPSLMKATIAVQVGASQGSGVIIDKEGHVLTAAHVVGEPGKDAIFIMPDGKRLKGKTLGQSRHRRGHDADHR